MKITEDYVSYEVAKLLKEKGFDEYYPLWYNLDRPLEGPFFYKEIGWYGHNSYEYNGKRIVSAPTLQMAIKWLREVHKINIDIKSRWKLNPYKIDYYYFVLHYKNVPSDSFIIKFDSYEEAVEAALKYCLENLV